MLFSAHHKIIRWRVGNVAVKAMAGARRQGNELVGSASYPAEIVET